MAHADAIDRSGSTPATCVSVMASMLLGSGSAFGGSGDRGVVGVATASRARATRHVAAALGLFFTPPSLVAANAAGLSFITPAQAQPTEPPGPPCSCARAAPDSVCPRCRDER